MHARLLHMFSNFPDTGHRVKLDNLFVSVNLARQAYSLPQKVLIHGVIRKNQQGVPPCVYQEEVQGKKADEVRGTMKAAVLKGDSKSSDLVVTSCYDQKPFYMLSASIQELTWDVIEKKVWSNKLNREIIFKFLRSNMSNEYNFEMNDNDIADQIR